MSEVWVIERRVATDLTVIWSLCGVFASEGDARGKLNDEAYAVAHRGRPKHEKEIEAKALRILRYWEATYRVRCVKQGVFEADGSYSR